MKLFSQNYGQVQSLGREDVGAPGRAFASKSRLLDTIYKGAGELSQAIERSNQAKNGAVYNKAWVNANSQQQDLKALLDSEPMMPRSELLRAEVPIPEEYGSSELIPTHSVYFNYYDRRLNEIKDEAVASLPDSATKGKFDNQWSNVYIGLRNVAAKEQVNRNMEVAEAQYNEVYESFLDLGNENLAADTIDEMYASGIINETEAVKRMDELPKEIDSRQIENVLLTGGERKTRQLVKDLTTKQYRVDDSDALVYVSKAITKLNRYDYDRDGVSEKYKTRNEIDAQVALLQGDMVFADLVKKSQQFTPEGFRRLVDTSIRVQKGDGVSDPETMTGLRRQVANIMFPGRDHSMTSAAESSIRQATQEWRDGNITKNEYDDLVQSIQTNRNMPYRTEDYKTVETLISKHLGVSVDRITMAILARQTGSKAYGNIGAKEKMAAQALEDLRSQVRLRGMDLDPMQWWVDNSNSYSMQAAMKGSRAQYNEIYGYVPNTDGSIDMDATKRSIFALEADGTIDSIERARRINMLGGD